MMSNISYDWIVLSVAAILLAVLSFLKRKKCRVYYTRAACNGIRHHFGNCFQRPYRLCRCGGFHLVQCNYRTGGSAAAVQHYLQHHEPWRIHTLKEYWSKTVFFLLLNTATASLLTLILAQAFQLGRGFHYTLPSDYKQHDVPAVLDTIVNLFPHNIAIVLQLFLVQPLVLAAVTKLNPIHFFRAFFPAGVVAFTSESSIGTIPVTVRQLRSAGVPGDIASFVAGLGANLGMPGCAGVWPMLLAVFAVHAQGLNYSPAQYLFLVVLTLLVSIGTVGVPGTATITATSLFAAAGLPIPFIAISQPISQIVDMGRTALNVAGAANTAVIVAQTEHQLDTDLYYGRKEYSDDLNDDEQFGQTSTQSLTGTGPSQRTNITNDAKFDSANVSQQQSGFTLNFAPNAVLSASSDDVCCGTKPNK